MSMNLVLRDTVTREECNLWQTPTHISYLCTRDPPNAPQPVDMVCQRYFLWLDSTANGSWESKADLLARLRQIRLHKAEVTAFMERVTNPEFHVM